jgi:hypothetical protein
VVSSSLAELWGHEIDSRQGNGGVSFFVREREQSKASSLVRVFQNFTEYKISMLETILPF